MTLRNPSLKEIEFLIGVWDIELTNASFLPDSSKKVIFSVHYEWKADGSVIAVQQKNEESKKAPPEANWIIGRDQDSDQYTVLYFDNRGVSRVYQMSFKSNNWEMWRDNPGFSQRFEGVVSEDRKTIEAKWEKSIDGGKNWEHDFNMTYRRK